MKIDKKLLEDIISQIDKNDSLENIFHHIKADILLLLHASRFTVYKKSDNGKEIVSFYMSSGDSASPIVLPINFSSIAGYVGSSKKTLSIADVYEPTELHNIEPKLLFDNSYDRQSGFLSDSMLVVPIFSENSLEGVLQILGFLDGGAFPVEIVSACEEIAEALVIKFKSLLKNNLEVYRALVDGKKFLVKDLNRAQEIAKEEETFITSVLKDHYDIAPKAIADCLSDFYQVPFVNSSTLQAAPKDLMKTLNANFLSEYVWVPIKQDANGVRVVMADPSNKELINEISNILNVKNIEVFVAMTEDILSYIGLDKFGDKVKKAEGVENIIEEIDFEADSVVDEKSDLMDSEVTSIIRLVNKIITDAVRIGASDVHIEPVVDKPGVVRMRVDGVCRRVVEIPQNLVRPVISRVKILSNLDIAERRKPQDGKMAVKMGGVPLELRIATLPVVAGESVVMRILQRGLPLSFKKLNFSLRNEKFIKGFLKHSHGLVLVVGPTGSGKTTTLHAILYLLNNEERKILTAEDPVEIVQDGLQQVQMVPKAGVTFASTLRAFLRCDPDVILIGEMRDLETASIGVEASLTGHLVFSTLHTNSAPETIVRLLDIGINALNFSDALIGVVSQRLARSLCATCKEPYTPNKEERDKLKNLYGVEYFNLDFKGHNLDDLILYKPIGCEKCSNLGYRGRMAIHEVMLATDSVKKLIATGGTVANIREQAMSDNMRDLGQDAISKILKGSLDLEMARKVGVTSGIH